MSRVQFRRLVRPQPAIRKPYRVFVNRNLDLSQILAIGFDMDYTLAVYRKESIENLAFHETLKKLVQKGYPEGIVTLKYDSHAMIRGLVLDKKYGNVFKMNQFGHVSRARHGLRVLTSEEIRGLYGNFRVRMGEDRFHAIDTLFDLPEAHLYAQLVEFLDRESRGKPVDYWKLFYDSRASLDESHRDSSIKAHIVKNPERYVIKDRFLARSLERMRDAGKRTFILTNSDMGYTDTLMDYLLSGELAEYRSWQDYFDRIIVDSRKPRFFREECPFLDQNDRPVPEDELSAHKVLREGNSRLFQVMEGVLGDQILFVGDHIYGDILRSKQSSGWRTLMIIEELEGELESSYRGRSIMSRLRKLEYRGNMLDYERHRLQRRIDALTTNGNEGKRVIWFLRNLSEMQRKRQLDKYVNRQKGVDQQILATDKEIAQIQRTFDEMHNRNWGPLLKDENEISKFGEQVKRFACVYTSRVSNLVNYPISKLFHSPIELMPHDLE